MELRLVMDFQSAVTDDTDVWFMMHSRIDDPLPIRRGVHIVRHPIAVIHSAYRYHQVCSESWAIDPTRATHVDGIRYDFSGVPISRSYVRSRRKTDSASKCLVAATTRSWMRTALITSTRQ
jgi:hypothetical protein